MEYGHVLVRLDDVNFNRFWIGAIFRYGGRLAGGWLALAAGCAWCWKVRPKQPLTFHHLGWPRARLHSNDYMTRHNLETLLETKRIVLFVPSITFSMTLLAPTLEIHRFMVWFGRFKKIRLFVKSKCVYFIYYFIYVAKSAFSLWPRFQFT